MLSYKRDDVKLNWIAWCNGVDWNRPSKILWLLMKQNAVQFTYLKIKMILKIGNTKSMYGTKDVLFLLYNNNTFISQIY